MKRIILVLVVFMLYNYQFDIRPNSIMASEPAEPIYPTYLLTSNIPTGSGGGSKLCVTIYMREGIEYRVFTNNTYDSKSIFVVNHTKEKLEIQLIRAQIAKLKADGYR